MTNKKCVGCGVVLQTENKDNLGYTPNIVKDYCMRCFRLKNYGEVRSGEVVDETSIINKVNKGKGFVFFLVDYLNINKYTLDIFKRVKLPKALVISKCDTLRKDMKFSKIKLWLNNIYDIKEDVLFVSSKNDFKSANIFKYMDKINVKTCYILGITNAGKSTFINSILRKNNIKKEIVTSSKPNTTLDFIKLHIDDYVIYDTPGFSYLNSGNSLIKSEIKPLTYNLKGDTTLIINEEFKLYFKEPNSVTIYIPSKDVKKVFKRDVDDNFNVVNVLDNEDIIISGLGFVNVKQTCEVVTSFEVMEVRADISGESYE